MGYRDKSDALQAQVGELQEELAEAKQKIARLTGEQAKAAPTRDRANWFLGAPTTLTVERTLPTEVTDDGFEQIATMLHERLDPRGTVTQVGRTLWYQDLHRRLTVNRGEGGGVVIAVHGENRDNLIYMALFWLLTWFFAFLEAVRLLRDVAHAPAWTMGPAVAFTGLTTWLAARVLFQWWTNRSRAKVTAVLEAVVELAIADQRLASVRPRVELAEAHDATLQQEVEAEMEEMEDEVVRGRLPPGREPDSQV